MTRAKQYQTRWVLWMRFFAVCTLVFVIVAFVRQQQKLGRMQTEKAVVDEQLTDIVRANRELEKRLEYMQTDQYIKDAARIKLGMVREGEIIYCEIVQEQPDDVPDLDEE